MSNMFLSILFLVLGVKPAVALSQFTTDYQITYEVNEQGITNVQYHVNQTNNLSRVYATDFSLSVSHTNIENLKVKDFSTVIDPDIILTDNITSINFPFKNKIVGKNKTHSFSIEYDTHDITNKVGSVWEINIPKINAKENINNLTINLKVPPNFPKPVYIDPKPTKVVDNIYTFSSHSLSNKPISAIFGEDQLFRLNATYYIKNELNLVNKKSIALPPDTSYQQVYIKSIDPKPDNIELDTDGNWLAYYTLKPKQDLTITLQQVIKLSFNPNKESRNQNLDRYLESTNTWDFNSQAFKEINVDGLNDPEQVFNYVVNSLVYNYSLVNKDPLARQSASYSLEHPTQSICTDFTDLFVALSRKNAIPAREIQGYAVSENEKLKPLNLSNDVLHAWPEYFDRQRITWIQVDPTWSNTTNGVDYFNKLDLNHIAFVIHGLDVTTPLPAGFYKDPSKTTKDIALEVTNLEQFPLANINVTLKEQKGKTLVINLENTSGVSLYSDMSVNPQGSLIAQTPLSLPPFSNQDLEIDLNSRPLFGKSVEVVTIEISGAKHTLPVNIKPLISYKLIALFSSVIALLIFLIIKKIKKTNSFFPINIKT